MEIKEILGTLAIIIALISYVPYLRDVISNKTKPHAVTWFIWGSLTAIVFVGQVVSNAGPGAWALGVTTFLCGTVFVLSLTKGKQNIVPLDIVMLIGGILAIILWLITKQPVLSVILVTIVDAMGFIPTIRKSWTRPHEETMSMYALSMLKHSLSLLAIHSYSVVTVLYPGYLVFANLFFIVILELRRRQLISPSAAKQAPEN